MKNIETNKNNSSNVWEDNPWNLPYNLEHVNKELDKSYTDTAPAETPVVSHAAKLAKIEKIFDDSGKARNDNSGRKNVNFAPLKPKDHSTGDANKAPTPEPQIANESLNTNDIDPEYTKTWPKNYDAASYYSHTWPDIASNSEGGTPIPGSSPIPITSRSNSLVDTAPDFGNEPPTKVEFWEDKENSRLGTKVRKLGGNAIRLARTTAAYGILSAGVLSASAKMAAETGKASLYKSVELTASKLGDASANPLSAYAASYVDTAPSPLTVFKEELKVKRGYAAKVNGKTPVSTKNPSRWTEGWWINQHRERADKYLRLAQLAYESGDTKSAERHLERAKDAKKSSKNPWNR